MCGKSGNAVFFERAKADSCFLFLPCSAVSLVGMQVNLKRSGSFVPVQACTFGNLRIFGKIRFGRGWSDVIICAHGGLFSL